MPSGSARRLLAGGGGGWDGGISTETILGENDAKAGIENAVSNDQFSSSYQATNAGYRDAYASIFPGGCLGLTVPDALPATALTGAPHPVEPRACLTPASLVMHAHACTLPACPSKPTTFVVPEHGPPPLRIFMLPLLTVASACCKTFQHKHS